MALDEKIFDLKERARIRAKLIRYMAQHGIGAPTLLNRIAAKAGRSVDNILLKTLQRFLGAQGRTNDAFLVHCAAFVNDFPDEDTAAELGKELAHFFELPAAANQANDPAGTAARAWLQGGYTVYFKGPRADGLSTADFVVLRKEDPHLELYKAVYSRCVMERSGDGGALLIREQISDPAFRSDDPSLRRSFEGVVLSLDPIVFIVSKDMATRLPRVCWLRKFAGRVLYGIGTEATLKPENAVLTNPVDTTDLKFAREESADG